MLNQLMRLWVLILLAKKRFVIKGVVEHNPYMKTFVFEESFKANPGQFAMVFIPGVGEKPFSLSSGESITVEKRGHFTEKFFEMGKGDFVYIREPLGIGFYRMNYLAIAGGSGIAPIIHLVHDGDVKTLLYGAKDKEHLILNSLEQRTEVRYATDDGSYGYPGFVTDLITKELVDEYEFFAICGPEVMMKHAADKLVEFGVPSENIELSLERYMKCGEGLCGICEISGRRVCVDGPVFTYDEVLKMPDFTKFKRAKSGKKVVL